MPHAKFVAVTHVQEPCPCGSGKFYASCCGEQLDRGVSADTAERLMRSRYSAYVLVRESYLLDTWHATTRPARLDLPRETKIKWLGLRILRTVAGGSDDGEGIVEFVARYKVQGKAERIHEASRFVHEDGRWFYVDGQIDPV